MISVLNHYTSQLLCLSVMIGIIQLILPNGKLKKDVIFVMMIVVTIMLVQPIISFLNQEIDFSKIYEEKIEEMEIAASKRYFEQNYQSMLKDTFESNLKDDIITRLKNAGYLVHAVKCKLDEETLEPKELHLQIETEDGFIQPVRIEVMKQMNSSDSLSPEEKFHIKKILADNYGVSKDHILINGE